MAQVQREILGGSTKKRQESTGKAQARPSAPKASSPKWNRERAKEAELLQQKNELNDTEQLNMAKRQQAEALKAFETSTGKMKQQENSVMELNPLLNPWVRSTQRSQETELRRLEQEFRTAATQEDADRIKAAYEKKCGEYQGLHQMSRGVYAKSVQNLYGASEEAEKDYQKAKEADANYAKLLSSYSGPARGLSSEVAADLKKREEYNLQQIDQHIKDLDNEISSKEKERDGKVPVIQYTRGAIAAVDMQESFNADIKAKQAERQEYADYLDFSRKYGSVKYEKDFASLSRYQKSKFPTYDYERLYEYVNGKDTANVDPEIAAVAQHMSQDEKDVYNYICAKEGKEKGKDYLNALKPTLNVRNRVKEERKIAEFTEKSLPNAIIANGASILASPFKVAAYIGQGLDYLMDGKIDQNAPYNRLIYGSNAVTSSTDKMVREKWGEPGSFAYNTGMSMLNFVMNLLVAKGIGAGAGMSAEAASNLSLALMGTGAAADTVLECKDRGLSDGQAFSLGTIAGLAEVVTEKVSVENLLDKTRMGESALGYFLQNVLAEGSEEVGSDVINTFADILIAKDKSQWNQAIQAYESQGMKSDKAFFKALTDQAQQMGLDFAGGAVSGGVMAGGALALNGVQNRLANRTDYRDAVRSGQGYYALNQLTRGELARQNGYMDIEQDYKSPIKPSELTQVLEQEGLSQGAIENLLGNQGDTAPKMRGQAQPQYSIETTQDGKHYVRADRQVISGNDPKQWAGQITNYINQQIRNGQDITLTTYDGDLLQITRDTAGKAQFRNLVKQADGKYAPMSDSQYAAKLRAEGHIDELAEISTRGKKTVPDRNGKHGKLASDGWNYRTAYFEDVDGKYYRMTISTAINGNSATVYNVNRMENSKKPYSINGTSANSGALWGSKAQVDSNIASSNIIPTPTENVNGKSRNRQYSIQELPNGEKVTVVDTRQNLFEGKPQKEYAKIARREILNHFKGQVLPLGENDLARITSKTASEYAYPNRALSDLKHNAKMRASTELDNLLRTAEYVYSAEDSKNHSEATMGFDYYKAKFVVDGHTFEGLLNIATSEKGRILYDITKIEEVSDSNGSATRMVADPSHASVGDFAGTNIAQSDPNFKYTQKNSFDSGKSYLSLVGLDPIAAGQMQRQMNSVKTDLEKSAVRWGVPADRVKTISEITGKVSVVFDGTLKGNVNGYYQDGVIHLNPSLSSNQAVLSVFGHELTHSLEKTSSYRELVNLVLNQIGNETAVRNSVNEKIELYRRNGVELDTTGAVRELVAEYASERLFSDEQVIQRLVQEKPTLAKKILSWIRETLAKLKNDTERAQLLQAERLYSRMLREAGNEKTQKALPNIRYSIFESDRSGNGKTYYRYSGESNGFNHNYGRAEFVDNPDSSWVYGDYLYTVNDSDLVPIESLKENIAKALEEDYENFRLSSDMNQFVEIAFENGESFSDMAEEFDPKNIVDSASAWDNDSMVQWFYDRFGEDGEMRGISTSDGAIVFDPDIITSHGEKTEYVLNNDLRQYSISESQQGESGEKSSLLDKAISMLDNGSTPSEVYGETGLVVMHNGDLRDGIGGEKIGAWKNGRTRNQQGKMDPNLEEYRFGDYGDGNRAAVAGSDNQIRRSEETWRTTERRTDLMGGVQGSLHSVPNSKARSGMEEGMGDGPKATRSSWAALSPVQKGEITSAINRRLNHLNKEQTLFFNGFENLEELAERFYSMLQEGRVVAEQWAGLVPDIQGLMDEMERLASDTERQYSISDNFKAESIITDAAPADFTGSPKQKVSQVRENTFENAEDIFTKADLAAKQMKKENFAYDVVTEQASMQEARERLAAGYETEVERVQNRAFWRSTDLDSAMEILRRKNLEARETGDFTPVAEWAKLIQEKGTNAGQMIQAFAKYSRTPEGILTTATRNLQKLVDTGDIDVDTMNDTLHDMAEFTETLDAIEEGEKGNLVDLIVRQAERRNTKVSKGTLRRLNAEPDFHYLYDFALTQLENIAADFEPSTFGKKLSTYQTIAHLLNVRTGMRNVVSNQMFDLVDSVANNISMLPDLFLRIFTGNRTVGFEKSWASKEKRQGAKQGLRRGSLEVSLDVEPHSSDGKSKYGTGGRRTWKAKDSRVMSRLEKAMGYELNVTDEFHKGSVRGEVLESLQRFVDNGTMTQEEALEFAEQEALYRSFQDDTLPGALLASLKSTMNLVGIGDSGRMQKGVSVKEFGLGDFVQKYTQVPGALISRAVEFSPMGYLKAIAALAKGAKASHKAGQGIRIGIQAQRKAALAIGRATTGTGLITAFAALAASGILRRGDDEKDKDAAALNSAEGVGGTQINLSAIGRLFDGEASEWRSGDVVFDLGFMEPLNAAMTLGSMVAQDSSDKGYLSKLADNSFESLFMAIKDTPTMQTLDSIYSTIQYHDEETDLPKWLEIPVTVAESGITGFVPSLVRQAAQATDQNYRDQYSSQDQLVQIGDKLKNTIPGLRQTLPEKLDNFGRPKTYSNPWLNAFNATMFPGNMTIYQQDDVSKELTKVYQKTGNSNIYPDRSAPYQVRLGEESIPLTAEDRTTYQKTRGALTKTTMADLMQSEAYRKAGDFEKAELLKAAVDFSNDLAKREFAQNGGKPYTNTTWDKTIEALENGISFGDYQSWKQSTQGMKDGEKRKVLSETNLPDTVKAEFYDMDISSSHGERIAAMTGAGLSFNEFLKVQDKYSNVGSDELMKAKDKATEFSYWVDQQGYTAGQAQAIKENFKFFTMSPASAGKYDKLAGAGISADTAYQMNEELNGLEPEEGKDQVSDSQKLEQIAFSGDYSEEDRKAALSALMEEDDYAKIGEAEKQGIGLEAYMDYYLGTKNLKGDVGENGKTISGSKREKVLSYIDQISGLTSEQKDYLYRQKGYAESKLEEAPWHSGVQYSGSSARHYTRRSSSGKKSGKNPFADVDTEPTSFSFGGNRKALSITLPTVKKLTPTRSRAKKISLPMGGGLTSRVPQDQAEAKFVKM